MHANRQDRIVILGRPSSGKSVFLTVLYQQLWDSPGDMTLRAADGITHAALVRDYASLAEGQWLPATQALQQYELELIYKGRTIPVTVLDYPGELYRRLFFEKRVDGEELEALYAHVSRATGVILLIDPQDLVRPGEAQVDTEYSALQVVEHFRSSYKGQSPPLVLVYTKRDENAELVSSAGGMAVFTRTYMRRLSRILKGVPLVHLSAVRTTVNDENKRMPWSMSSEEQVAIPLRFMLKQFEAAEAEQNRNSARDTWRRMWKRCWRPVLIVSVAIWLFIVFFFLGAWVAI